MKNSALHLRAVAWAIITALVSAIVAMQAVPAQAQPTVDQPGRERGVPVAAQAARVVDGAAPPVAISKDQYLVAAAEAGVSLSSNEQDLVALATSCWRWDAYKKYENAWGADLVTSHHRVNWCGDGRYIRVHAFTERWGTTHWPGWNYQGVTSKSQRYGVGWNQYRSTTQNKFCYINFYDCVQEKNPYHSTIAYPNGAANWY